MSDATASPSRNRAEIPDQAPIPWSVAFGVSWAGLRRRFLRSLITMTGVVLAIAFLAYMLLNSAIEQSLVAALGRNVEGAAQLSRLLQTAGVDIINAGQADQLMYMLIGLSLLICLVGIINSMLMSVTERVKEIGTLKCLGALDSFIIKTYFIESSLQGVLGTLIGMGLGTIVSLWISVHNFKAFTLRFFPWLDSAQSLGVTLLIGSLISVIAAIGPAYLAARKEPVEAMRVEE